MLKGLARLLRRKAPEQTEAYQIGQRAAASMADDAESIVDELLRDRRLGFVSVLSGRLEGIKEVEGISYTQQAQIEFKVMLENWSERIPEQKEEVWNIIVNRWPHELIMNAPDALRLLISNRVEGHYAQLFSDGLEYAADAVIARDRNTGEA